MIWWIVVGVPGSIILPTLFGWWIGSMSKWRRNWVPHQPYYDENGVYIDPLKEWRANRALGL